MKIATVSLTENGRKISEKISYTLSQNHICTRYAIEKYIDDDSVAFSDLKRLTADIFDKYDAIVFISACGIAVRMIAPHIVSKITDPAVIVVDEQAKFAVSLLSGHIGGANALTERIAEILNATSVITTATDVGGKFSPDAFAVANNLHIYEMETAKKIAAAIVNDEKIGFYSEYPYENLPCEFFGKHCTSIGICISTDIHKKPFDTTLHLIPKNIVIGVGCKKNTPCDEFSKFISAMLCKHDVPVWRVCEIHSVDIKSDETAIRKFSQDKAIPVKFYTAEQLMSVDGDFEHSDFVMKITGADNICERGAAIDGGKLIIHKQAENGITFAAAEKNISIDFERKII